LLVTLTIAVSNLLGGWAADEIDPRVVMGILAGVSVTYAAVWTGLTAGIRRRERVTAPVG
ncbi:MAG TPA: hypothetical protein VE889_07885, partial [Actinomycetota bacterium]|nr:hypothetical protein [Actinomycetota bacterium]